MFSGRIEPSRGARSATPSKLDAGTDSRFTFLGRACGSQSVSNHRKKPAPRARTPQGPRQPGSGRDATDADAAAKDKESRGERVKKSRRALKGMAAGATEGEWMGGPIPPAFDVACFSRT